jgi:hypothetical protein
MSPIFVLIWVMVYSTGVSTGSQEFTNEVQCQAAANALIKTGYKITTLCTRK